MIRVGIIGTSWWSEAMYLPALADHPSAKVVAVCGRTESTARALADRWGVPGVYTDWRELVASGSVDAIIVASPNDTHQPITMAALDAGLHVLCDKPIALTAAAALEMAERAEAVGAITMTPFTYRYMPMFVETKRRIDEGFLGRPFHLNLRYYTEYGRSDEYSWRFDRALAGSGVLGDLGSHWLHVAEWLLGPIETIGAVTRSFVERAPRPDGTEYEQTEDSAIMTVAFAGGAIGSLQVCAVSWEGTAFGQTHHLDLHGSDGTIYAACDWDEQQHVLAVQAGTPRSAAASGISESTWGGLRRSSVHDTYRDVFRSTEAMTRGWVSAIAAGRPVEPSLRAGARAQILLDAAIESAAGDGRQIAVPPVSSEP